MIRLTPERFLDYLDSKEKIINDFERRCRQIDLATKKIILFNVPIDFNLGDHAQTVCIIKILHNLYPEYKIYSFPVYQFAVLDDMCILLERFKFLLNTDDLVFFHSGYHMSDIFCNQYSTVSPTAVIQMAALNVLSKIKTVLLPQTINLNEKNMRNYAEVINDTGSLLFCRDTYSFNLALSNFHGIKTVLMPDLVTSLIGRIELPYKAYKKKKSVYIALRNRSQVESKISDVEINAICDCIADQGADYLISSTSDEDLKQLISHDVESAVMFKITEMSKYDLIITDLYHGMIFSVIANVPVIVMPSSDHKVSSGVDFFREFSEYDNRLFYSTDMEEIREYIEELLKEGELYIKPSGALWDKWSEILFNSLKEFI